MATIADVAQVAGVSVATVSRVLGGKVSKEGVAARRVLEAVRMLEYVPSAAARNLRTSVRRVVFVLVPNIGNPYYAQILSGIGDAAQQFGVNYFMCNTADAREQEEVLLRLSKRQADGAILMATEMGSGWLKPYAQRYPIVQCSEYDPDVNIARVSVDNYRASLDVMEYLLGLDHRRIGIIASENRYASTALRLKGYKDALHKAAIPVKEAYIRYADAGYSFKSGFDAAISLLSQEKRPTALFAISDVLALGAIAGARELGFRVPKDVSVVGFDDVEYTTMFKPYVTTVVQPAYDIGFRAMDLLNRQFNQEDAPRRVLLPHRLAIRDSCEPLKNVLDFAAYAPLYHQ